jgi:hypothetical protein
LVRQEILSLPRGKIQQGIIPKIKEASFPLLEEKGRRQAQNVP